MKFDRKRVEDHVTRLIEEKRMGDAPAAFAWTVKDHAMLIEEEKRMDDKSVYQMGRVVWKFQIPVDDQTHTFEFAGDVLHVECFDPREVTFWALRNISDAPAARRLQVYGTGHPFTTASRLQGTAVWNMGLLVWHLVEFDN